MNELIKVLLSLSVSGTLLLLLILGLKQLYKNKFSKRWQYYIWIIVVLRFLIPFAPSSMNAKTLFKRIDAAVVPNKIAADAKIFTAKNTNDNEAKPPQISPNENVPAKTPVQKPTSASVYLFFVWIALALVLFVRRVTIYQGFSRYIKAGNTEVSDLKTLNLLSDCEEKLHVKTRVELCRNTLIASPILIGFFHPNIILPAIELKDKEYTFIFMHELYHYKQRDMFYKWLIQIVICIHWFNPFVYLLEKEINKACELSCDEKVISMLDDKARREYGDTLISFLKSTNLYKSSLVSVTLTEGAEQLKERLGAIMNFRRKTKAVWMLSGVLTMCIILGAAIIPVYPVTAAIAPYAAKISKSSVPKDKNYKTDTYIYDENLDSGWYLGADKNNWDWADDDNWDWADDDNWDWNDDEEFAQMYGAYGIKKSGKSIYYQGRLVYIFLDERSYHSYYLDMNPEGTICIRINRDEQGKIAGVSYMTENEVADLIGKPFGGLEEVPLINTKEWDSTELSMIEAYYDTDNIFILPSPTDKVILKEYLTENQSGYYASTETKNNILRIRAGDRPIDNYLSYIEIYIPKMSLNSIKAKTVSGAIGVNNFTGALALSTTSGLIDICDSNIAGSIQTVSGEVVLEPAGILGDLAVHTISGKIEAVFQDAVSSNIKAKTVSGKIKSSYFPIQSQNEKDFSGAVGSNPHFTMLLQSVSGSIDMD